MATSSVAGLPGVRILSVAAKHRDICSVICHLNLASNWIRKFPRTSPASGMAAVRNHHVMILMSQVDGINWAGA